ncbi:glutaminyl-peptide cyclotransferase [Deinococcus yavapaiensis]|uniref:Glutamine cyclotransferase n=1 Tax=Deinococcus yavapaiensis KR-236 TaxID=694435 RepID=A0A318SBB5_9DEIO|nr:glutaminyl-peptide cyclotransferase [Deinococcus yavapaiensis]PYE56348.1 glutamine cyclotransferase [Deinococcus yavapaiensis KR-236]
MPPRFAASTLVALSLLCSSCASSQSTASVPTLRVEVVKRYVHDAGAFTQGLFLDNGVLFEGTGLEGRSELRRVKLETGEVLQRRALPASNFGEGIAPAPGGRIVQLTWRSNVAYVLDKATFALQRTFAYPVGTFFSEGWGLTSNGSNLILSDGSSNLFFLDPTTFQVVRKVAVTSPEGPVANLNELEFVDGQVYANVWLTNRIARIDPSTGRVTAWIDATNLADEVKATDPNAVLNGIAYDAATKRLFLTGKLWPTLFEVKLVQK